MNKKLIKGIIKDERKAPNDYRRLLSTLSNKHDKVVVRRIMNDERRHFVQLKKINKRLQ